jgi:hypothetical protein
MGIRIIFRNIDILPPTKVDANKWFVCLLAANKVPKNPARAPKITDTNK